MIRTRARYNPPNLAEFISSLPRNTRGLATEAAADYLIGDGRHGLKHYPPYKWVTRRRAYGKTFVSAKQRRYVMAMIRAGRIDPGAPHRTGIIQRGWRKEGRGAKVKIVNDARGVEWVHDDKKQARLNALVGWRKTSVITQSNEHGSVQAAQRAVDKYIQSKIK